jgi:hypothetical protein
MIEPNLSTNKLIMSRPAVDVEYDIHHIFIDLDAKCLTCGPVTIEPISDALIKALDAELNAEVPTAKAVDEMVYKSHEFKSLKAETIKEEGL